MTFILFQLIAVPLCVLLAGRSLYRFFRGDRHRWGALVGMVLWSLATVAILMPELTTIAAVKLGIGRGTDLLVYLSAIGFLLAFFYFYQKCRRLESDLTQVVRNLAIDDAQQRWPRPGRER